MRNTERKRIRKRIKRIADGLSDEGLERLYATAEAECAEDPDCEPGDPGSGDPPPDPPPNP